MTTALLTHVSLSVLLTLTHEILREGGSVLLPESDALLADPRFVGAVLGSTPPHATLAYGQPLTVPGFHVVQTDSDHWVENLAGLGGCGAQVFLGFVGDTPQQGHPMLPVLQIAEEATLPAAATADVDVVFTADGDANLALLHRLRHVDRPRRLHARGERRRLRGFPNSRAGCRAFPPECARAAPTVES